MSLFHRTQQQSTDTMDNGAKLITVAHPKSPISEQFRTIRTNINFMAIDKPIKTLAMTSANVNLFSIRRKSSSLSCILWL